ncbi:SubName: Full=Uncharacterized protein {ECO:0000313/EMBL:CCA75628.1} [Serendipita indica DSM 11827]|nr:SubName: Full=Uncharacterized protein {ECO:0000313/EMBL:CCA75628.1} [Serendipita indica DSM 11827]
MALVALTLWSYDILLTIADELELLWSRNGALVKTLYLICRYLPIVGASIFGAALLPTWQRPYTQNECQITWTILDICMLIQYIVSPTIFILRLCAIYCMSPRVRQLLLLCLGIHIVASIIVYTSFQITVNPLMRWNILARVCVLPHFKQWSTVGLYIVPLFIEVVILVAVIAHALGFGRSLRTLNRSATGGILQTLYVDGMIYYLGIICIHVAEVITFYVAPLGLQVLLTYFEYLLCSTLTSRFFLHFRRKVLQSQAGSHRTGFITSEMEVAGGGETTGKAGRWTLANAFRRHAPEHTEEMQNSYQMTATSSASGGAGPIRTRMTEQPIAFTIHERSTETMSPRCTLRTRIPLVHRGGLFLLHRRCPR